MWLTVGMETIKSLSLIGAIALLPFAFVGTVILVVISLL